MTLHSVSHWFACDDSRTAGTRLPVPHLRLEQLECREVPTTLVQLYGLPGHRLAGGSDLSLVQTPLTTPSSVLGRKMSDFLQAAVEAGRRIGGGYSHHLAVEALRVAGADFTRAEPPGTLDFVWTTNRVARLTPGDPLVGYQFQIGDIIQHHHATFGAGYTLKHHTQVVAAVDPIGRITQVFEQGVDGDHTAKRGAAIELSKLTGGSVSVYRPVPRAVESQVEFTLVNNTKSEVTVTRPALSPLSPKAVTLTATGTTNSFQAWQHAGSGEVKLAVNGRWYTFEDGAGYEIVTLSGRTTVRRI
jgi:hypothetical protein